LQYVLPKYLATALCCFDLKKKKEKEKKIHLVRNLKRKLKKKKKKKKSGPRDFQE
jgi:hypothetical protein